MKRIAALSLALVLALGLAACGGGTTGTAEIPAANSTTPAAETPAPQAGPVEVVVFAAASLEASLTEIADLYKEVAPQVTLTFTIMMSCFCIGGLLAGRLFRGVRILWLRRLFALLLLYGGARCLLG